MMILITGGPDSGKSAFAERLAAQCPEPVYYIATMRPCGEEGRRRIVKHRDMRKGKGFVLIEKHTDVGAVEIDAAGTVLLECMCNLTANEMFDVSGRVDKAAYDRTLKGMLTLAGRCENIIIVTTDYDRDDKTHDESTKRYIETLDRLKRALSAVSDKVYALADGEPVRLK
jgi:adenosylcobinamide kinase/adenosylcobinamide-phosphate guanylyltransferase